MDARNTLHRRRDGCERGEVLLVTECEYSQMREAEWLEMLLLWVRLWKYSTHRTGLGQTPTAKYTESVMARYPTGQIQLEMMAMEHLEPVAPSG